jgi:U32 family peptidase
MVITLRQIGRVVHYYDKIGVAVIELQDTLSKGDKIRFIRGGEDQYDQKVKSLQIEHKEVERAEAGDTIGVAVEQMLKDATDVFLIEEE